MIFPKPNHRKRPIGPFEQPLLAINPDPIDKVHVTYQNGDVYEGGLNERKKREGHGSFITANRKKPNGYEYHGPWHDGGRQGSDGKCFFYNDSFYIGDWVNDMRHGRGELFGKYSEERYVGEWDSDLRHGKGIVTAVGAINSSGGGSHGGSGLHHYEGRFRDDRRHGRGILKMTQNHHRMSFRQMEV